MKPITKPFYVAGVQFQRLTGFPNSLPEQSVAQLRHNPQNAFDPFAVEVHVGGYMIGHIPRNELALVHHLGRDGHPVTCLILNFDPTQPPYTQFRAQLYTDNKVELKVEKVNLS